MEMIMTSHDEAALLAFQCMAYGKGGIAATEVGREFWGIYAVA